jgi:peptide/nickel transport system ATP-binding protein
VNVLDIQQLHLTLPAAVRPVLDQVDLSVAAGETVALVGESGSGKTLTARAVLRLLPKGAAATGSVQVAGAEVLTMGPRALQELRRGTAAMIFQDPRAAINPLRRVGDFLTESRRTSRGYGKQQAAADAARMVKAVGLTETTLRQYPGALSGGMLQRVMIAAALMGGPKLLLADEPTTALDVITQAEVVALLGEMRERFGTGLLFITHDLCLASAISDRIYVMYAGRIAEAATSVSLFTRPHHPYTKALLDSTPRLDTPQQRLEAIDGQPPGLDLALSGCAFAPRCPAATAVCRTAVPDPQPVAGHTGHIVACHHGGHR